MGQRFDYQLYPAGMRGGISTYAYSGVIDGFAVSAPAVVSANVFSVNISPGAARLDGVRVELANALTGVQIEVNPHFNLATAIVEIPVFLLPIRRVPALLAPPTNPAPVEGDRYVQVADLGDYLQSLGVFEFKGGAWKEYNAASAPPEYGHNSLPLNGIVAQVDTATTKSRSFASADEKIIYHRSQLPPYVCRASLGYMREGAGVQIATIAFSNGTATVAEGLNERDRVLI